ncbi:hypothetical protein ACNUDN_10120 [Mycobacterium sp. smrl_JER01]|uniref:hypothetical protein n=1 Tax=Mycobacterium sp. smrl_JER01 TaxID=3402633 RepID=UPI003AC87C70
MRTPKTRARRVRGALVGACSAALTLGAHAAAGGALPGGGALVLALLLCATVGALSAVVDVEGRTAQWAATTAALGIAQALGHVALTVTGHHHGGGEFTAAPAMVAAHALAAILLGAAIAAVEYLYLVCISVLCWLRLFTRRMMRPAPRAARRSTTIVVARPVLATGLGMRAPPPAVATA